MKITKFGVILFITFIVLSILHYLDVGEFKLIGGLVIAIYILEVVITSMYKAFKKSKKTPTSN